MLSLVVRLIALDYWKYLEESSIQNSLSIAFNILLGKLGRFLRVWGRFQSIESMQWKIESYEELENEVLSEKKFWKKNGQPNWFERVQTLNHWSSRQSVAIEKHGIELKSLIQTKELIWSSKFERLKQIRECRTESVFAKWRTSTSRILLAAAIVL